MPARRLTKAHSARRKNWEGFPEVVVESFEHLPAYSVNLKDRITWCQEHAEPIAEALYQKCHDAGATVLSLDVFDTVLLRNDIPEAERYAEMSALALTYLRENGFDSEEQLTADDLLLARANGLMFAYRTTPQQGTAREGHIETVYKYQATALGLPDDAAMCLHKAEIDYEASVLAANPAISLLMQKAKAAGHKVVLLSDMYLPAAMIEELLNAVFDSAPPYDLLLSSADSGHSKRGGSAFPLVEETLELGGETVFHLGDSLTSDVSKPFEYGWKSFYFPISPQEATARQARLKKFVQKMKKSGLDITRWAQA